MQLVLILLRDLLVVARLETGGQRRSHAVPQLLVRLRTVAGDGDVVEGVRAAQVELLRERGVHQGERCPDEIPGLAEAHGADHGAGHRRLGAGGDQPDLVAHRIACAGRGLLVQQQLAGPGRCPALGDRDDRRAVGRRSAGVVATDSGRAAAAADDLAVPADGWCPGCSRRRRPVPPRAARHGRDHGSGNRPGVTPGEAARRGRVGPRGANGHVRRGLRPVRRWARLSRRRCDRRPGTTPCPRIRRRWVVGDHD